VPVEIIKEVPIYHEVYPGEYKTREVTETRRVSPERRVLREYRADSSPASRSYISNNNSPGGMRKSYISNNNSGGMRKSHLNNSTM
jgi:hypothetical protein